MVIRVNVKEDIADDKSFSEPPEFSGGGGAKSTDMLSEDAEISSDDIWDEPRSGQQDR